MNLSILNREFQHPADGWYQIEARGFHPATTEGGEKVVQVIDDKAIASITNKFNAQAAASTLRHGKEMLVDREHFKHDSGKDTVAYAWMSELANRADGLYSRQRWTDTGKPAVDGGSYRFFSTEYEGAMETVPDAEIPADVRNKFPGRRFVRPLELTGLSLTNMNRNRGQAGITNREDETKIRNGDLPGHEFHGNQFTDLVQGDAGGGREAGDAMNHAMKSGKPEDFKKAAALHAKAGKFYRNLEQTDPHSGIPHGGNALAHEDRAEMMTRFANDPKKAVAWRERMMNLKNKDFPGAGASAEGQQKQHQNKKMKDIAKLLGLSEDATETAVSAEITKLKNRAAELETSNLTLLGEQCDALMSAHGIKPEDTAKRDKLRPVLTGLKNREDREAFLKECVAAPATSKTAAGQTVLRNRDAKAPGTQNAETDEQAKADKIRNRATELQGKGVKFADAFAMATREFHSAN